MASSFDLAPRLAALQDAGLVVESDYNGNPARWLVQALQDCDVRVINVKGIGADDTIVMLKLSKLEALVAAAEHTVSTQKREAI